MSNLTSTVPSAFNALYGLLNTAGQAQSPELPVFHTELQQYEPAAYVMLGDTPSGRKGIQNHRFDPAALGAQQYPQYETYELCGYVRYFLGDVDPAAVLTQTWALYQAVVMNTVIANRGAGGYVLGDSTAPIAWILPDSAEYTGAQGTMGDGPAGFLGTLEFCYSVKARLTVT